MAVGRILHPTHDVYLIREGNGESLLGRCVVASGTVAKARGLLVTERPPGGEGMLLRRCSSVHTLGMSFPIDVFFLRAQAACREDTGASQGHTLGDGDWLFSVVSVACGVEPWRLPIGPPGTTDVLELATPEPPGVRPATVREGDLLVVRRNGPEFREGGRAGRRE